MHDCAIDEKIFESFTPKQDIYHLNKLNGLRHIIDIIGNPKTLG